MTNRNEIRKLCEPKSTNEESAMIRSTVLNRSKAKTHEQYQNPTQSQDFHLLQLDCSWRREAELISLSKTRRSSKETHHPFGPFQGGQAPFPMRERSLSDGLRGRVLLSFLRRTTEAAPISRISLRKGSESQRSTGDRESKESTNL